MKRISSKIVVCLLLTLFLWSGVGFGFGKGRVYAFTTTSPTDITQKLCNGYVTSSPDWATCYTKARCGTDTSPSCISSAQKEVDAFINGGVAGLDKVTGEVKPSFWDWLTKLGVGLITGPIGKIVMTVQGVLLQAIAIPVMSVLFRISAALLDLSINFTLNSANMTKSGVADGITTVWVLLRNVFNITFIFILLYTAIKTIVGSASANTKKMIANVVIAALLINFSLFITRIIIDAGNILAVNLYNLIVATHPGSSLDDILMNGMGLTGAFGFAKEAAGSDWSSVFSVQFGIISYLQLGMLITAFIVFMYAMLLMVARTIVLIFLMTLSPLGFMGNVLPKIEEYAKMWRETLYGQVMIAPIFLFFVYLIVKIQDSINTVVNTANTTVAAVSNTTAAAADAVISTGAVTEKLTGEAQQYMAFFKYMMVIMLLIIAVKTTKKMTGEIGKVVEGLGKWAAGVAIGAATGGVALLGRNVLGRAGGAAASSERLTNAAKEGGLKGIGARLALRGASATSKASFDVRNTESFKKSTGFIGDQTGLKVDYDRGVKIKKGGFQGQVERSAEAQAGVAKIINKGHVNVTDEEVNNKITERSTNIINSQTEIKRLKSEDNLSDPAKEEISGLNKEIIDLESQKAKEKDIAKLNQIDEEIKKKRQAVSKIKSSEGNLNDDTKEKLDEERGKLSALKKQETDPEKIKKEIIKTKRAERVRAYAKTAKGSIINAVIGSREKASEEIEKVATPKDYKTLAAEALTQKEKEDKAAGIEPGGGEKKEEKKEEPKPEAPTPTTPPNPAP